MIPSSLIPQLSAAADTALVPVLQSGAASHGQAQPTAEVGFVAAAVLGGVPAIARAWRSTLRKAGYRLHMHGVFCHNAPKATFTDSTGNKVSCELADLLVVVDDLISGSGRRWAVLIQAKMANPSGGKSISGQDDLRQLELLTNWPPFDLPASYQCYSRDFSTCMHSGQPFDCGRYGLIDTQPLPYWHQQAPAMSMPSGGIQLGSFLARMLETGQTGFGREATGRGDDWSRTVDELMKVTYSNLFTYASGFGAGNRQQRGHSAMTYVSAYGPGYWFPRFLRHTAIPPSGGRHDGREEGGDGGLSILRIGIAGRGEK